MSQASLFSPRGEAPSIRRRSGRWRALLLISSTSFRSCVPAEGRSFTTASDGTGMDLSLLRCSSCWLARFSLLWSFEGPRATETSRVRRPALSGPSTSALAGQFDLPARGDDSGDDDGEHLLPNLRQGPPVTSVTASDGSGLLPSGITEPVMCWVIMPCSPSSPGRPCVHRGGERTDARALVGFVPDCVLSFHDCCGTHVCHAGARSSWRRRYPYLALPFDLIPDFIPVAGQADDAILVALVPRMLKRTEPVVFASYGPVRMRHSCRVQACRAPTGRTVRT